MRALLLILLLPISVMADDTIEIYQTLPGTSIRNYAVPPQGYRIEQSGSDTVIRPTLPYTSIPDYAKPGAVIDGNTIYPTLPGTGIRDYSQPGYVIRR
jgi:hypothetical protein